MPVGLSRSFQNWNSYLGRLVKSRTGKAFYTFDTRQKALAAKVGMKVKP